MYSYLSEDFLSKYKNLNPLTPLGEFVFYRTYSRYLPKEKRRETWMETCKRAVEYNISLEEKHLTKIGYESNMAGLVKESEQLFDSMFHTRQFVSGRTLWIGGAENGVADKYPLSNFNCSFTNIETWDDFCDVFYLLMIGAGVGFKCTQVMAKGLAPIRTGVKLLHSEYSPVPKKLRLEHTKIVDFENGYVKIYIGDSKEGWVEALRGFFTILTDTNRVDDIHTIKISYDSIRPRGERLKTFGGTASGPEPIKEMFEKIDKVIKNEIDLSLAPLEKAHGQYYHVRPIHVLDIGNLIGQAVVVGGVRRSAQIFLMDSTDWECILAKYGLNGVLVTKSHEDISNQLTALGVRPAWFDDPSQRQNLFHRMLSNNSMVFTEKPSKKMLNLIFTLMKTEGEPGFWNAQEAGRRRPNWKGGNPCAEILLDSKGVCNLTTVNLAAHVKQGYDSIYTLDQEAVFLAQKLSARAGLRMTLLDLELPKWDVIQKRDRLIGTSLTGVQDTFSAIKFTDKQQEDLLKRLASIAIDEASKYAKHLRVAPPLLVTTVKPEGTLSLVAGGVSSGLHAAHSPYYIRRIRITAEDPLAKVVKELGWPINPEVGTVGNSREEKMKNARTLVIDFPVKTTSTKTKNDLTVKGQFDTYFMFQNAYTQHNSSNTITVKPDEWAECENIIWDKWNSFLAVSFLAHDGGTYELAPYEEITKNEYNEMISQFKPFDSSLLSKYEKFETDFELLDPDCDTGVCPIR